MRSKKMARLVGLLTAALLVGAQAGASSQAEPLKKRSSAAQIAMKHLGVNRKSAKVTDLYTSRHNRVTHVYLRQIVKGEEVMGAEATVNIQNGVVVFSGTRFVDPRDAEG